LGAVTYPAPVNDPPHPEYGVGAEFVIVLTVCDDPNEAYFSPDPLKTILEVPALIVAPEIIFHPVLAPPPIMFHVLAPHVIAPPLLTVTTVPHVIVYPLELNTEFTVIVLNKISLAADNILSFIVIVGAAKLVELNDIVDAGVELKLNETVLGIPVAEKVHTKFPPI
jgi:hypothetical protein